MSVLNNYFFISQEILGNKKIFPYHLFVYNSNNGSISPFLKANSPLITDKLDFLEFILSKGGKLAVDKKQKQIFLTTHSLREEDVEGLQEVVHHLEEKRIQKIQDLKEQVDISGEVKFKEEFLNAVKNDDYSSMIERVRMETETFSVRVSHTVSLAIYLSETLLIEDSFVNRIVAVSYYLAKNCDMKDEETLGDLICAAFFSHIGMTQLDYNLGHKPQIEYNKTEKKEYRKHPNLSHHLLNKSEVDLSNRCMNIIFQHHERNDGSGFPMYKKGEHIDQLSLILGAVSHIFEYSEGKVTGTKTDMKTIIRNLKNKTFSAGLEFEFGDKIYESLIYILNTDSEIEESA
ncbi:HD-GYP domain-containing protein [Halobacteriovorax sp.]|uniref:HD-GYP domain-containing protein n=1 Tax=Halobacteriovorax sp. TaxID=2020862 RepID=UPI00356B1501